MRRGDPRGVRDGADKSFAFTGSWWENCGSFVRRAMPDAKSQPGRRSLPSLTSVGLNSPFPVDLPSIFVWSKPAPGGMAEVAVRGPLRVSDLANQVGADPDGVTRL